MKPAPLKGRTWNPYTIPDVIDPGGVRCVKVYIPDSLQWLQIFAAVMDTMCHWKNYELLGDTSAAECAALMRSIMQQYNNFESCTDAALQESWDEDLTSLCESLRYNPVTGKFEAWCCGAWVAIDGQPANGFASGQPGPGAGQPGPGTCKSYHANMLGGGYWLAPLGVTSGDVITVSNATGATYDGNRLDWYCADGTGYVLGFSTGITQLVAGDPLPTVPHMKLIAKIGSTAYNIGIGSAFTVPAGISNQPITFQVNDADLTNDYGDLTFDVEFCNNTSAAWTQVFDFTVNAYGSVWSIINNGSTPVSPEGVYVAGTGYRTAVFKFSTTWYRGLALQHNKTYNQTSFVAEFAFTPGTYGGSTTDITYVQIVNPGGVRVNEVLMPTTPTSPKSDAIARSVTSELVAFQCGKNLASADPGGQVTLTKITITGTGTNPF